MPRHVSQKNLNVPNDARTHCSHRLWFNDKSKQNRGSTFLAPGIDCTGHRKCHFNYLTGGVQMCLTTTTSSALWSGERAVLVTRRTLAYLAGRGMSDNSLIGEQSLVMAILRPLHPKCAGVVYLSHWQQACTDAPINRGISSSWEKIAGKISRNFVSESL